MELWWEEGRDVNTRMCNAAPLAQMDDSSVRRRLRQGTACQREHLYPSISSRGATGDDAAGRRASHMRARLIREETRTGADVLLHPRLHNNNFKKAFSRNSLIIRHPLAVCRFGSLRFSAVFRSQTSGDGGETSWRCVARVASDQCFLTNAAVIEDRAR